MNLHALPDDILDSFADHLLLPYRDARGCVSIQDAFPHIAAYAQLHPRLVANLTHVDIDLDRDCARLFRPLARRVRKLSLRGSSSSSSACNTNTTTTTTNTTNTNNTDTSYNSARDALFRGLAGVVTGVEALTVSGLCGISEASWVAILSANRGTLRELHITSTLSTAWKASMLRAAGIGHLRALTIDNCANITAGVFSGLIASNAHALKSVTVHIGNYYPAYYDPAAVIAAHCTRLESLELGRIGSTVASITAAIAASRPSLSSLVLHARQLDGTTAILPREAVQQLRLLELRTLDIGGGGIIPLDVAIRQGRKVYLSGSHDREDVEKIITIIKGHGDAKVAQLDLHNINIYNINIARLLFTPHLRTLRLAAMHYVDLGAIGRATGNLTHITLQDLPDIEVHDIRALLACNKGHVQEFNVIGPKCRRLSNVSIINALADLADAKLRRATFPRWSLAVRPSHSTPPCITQAVAKFRATAPMAVIRSE